MAEGNHLCETQNCKKAATAFGLKGALKTRSCDLHIAALVAKKMTVQSIDGYNFISNLQDVSVFEERKTKVEEGLNNLKTLEADVDEEYRAALELLWGEKRKLLNAIEAIFSKIEVTVTKRHKELKEQISFLAANLNEYVKLRENALNPTSELLYGGMKETPSFINFAIEDVSIPVPLVINQYWSVSVGSIESLLKIAVSMPLLPATVESARKYNQKGNLFKISKRLKEAEENYLQAKAIYEECAPNSIDAASNLDDLGAMYRKAKRWSEAEVCHRQAQVLFERTDPQCQGAARNQNNFGLLCFDLNRLDEAEQHYQESKSICERAGKQTNLLAHALRGLGFVRKSQRRYGEAVELFKQAQPIFDATEPQSIDAATNHFQLGLACSELKLWRQSEESYLQAKRIYETACPQSSSLADCLYNLGVMYEAQNRFEESLTSFRAAGEVYSLNNDEKLKTDSNNSVFRVQVKRNKK